MISGFKRQLVHILTFFLLGQSLSFAQSDNDSISENHIRRILYFLASDSLKGRGNGSEELLQAAKLIGSEFDRAGLYPLSGLPSYYLSFSPFNNPSGLKDELLWNEEIVSQNRFLYFSASPGRYVDKKLSDFKIIKTDSSFDESILERFCNEKSDVLIWTSRLQPDGKSFFRQKFKVDKKGMKNNVLLVLSKEPPVSLLLTAQKSYYSSLEYNIVGIIPGKSKSAEVVLFSAHYDHIGTKGGRKNSAIMNGANDNASGITALLLLAQYYAKQNKNERTLMFCAFAGEESGLLGSKDFLQRINPNRISAMINIEMVGIPQYGKKTIFITGEEYSSLPAILKENITGVRVIPDQNKKSELFKRSDNYPFARKGVPAHTIMTSDDFEKCYHKACDDAERIDVSNMVHIIKSIAKGCNKLINGEDTPSRINLSELH